MKFPFIAKIKTSLFTNLFTVDQYVLVEEENGGKFYIETMTSQDTNIPYGTTRLILPVEQVTFVEEIPCEGNEVGDAYTEIVEKAFARIQELTIKNFEKVSKKLIQCDKYFNSL
jgi:hypothetical protein